MKKLGCLLLLMGLPLGAHAYPIELEKQLNGAEVSATTQDIDHNIAGLMLYNYGQRDAECKAVFRNGPEAPRIRQASLAPGANNNLVVRFSRSVIRLRVDLTCKPK
ncbi:3-phosphoglycerate kinase [Pseudomonas sp. NCHU5208]|uniref:3-phosphoglycerate kinase n=1 Tax=unclassified Pseudomonas TaxID=196821 RepID=UPI0023F76CB4|nr:3-phosphoglycerate kinase [Pseudomonas sp. AA-38]